MTTAALPAEILYGHPMPTRLRWQPLRAGILGLFRYDEQSFVLHNGRLLLRGNNGSGKSMALEVLLPYVLDADLSPERLSTFGGRERGMYLWLLGHDTRADRGSARGYVWVEFGRATEAGPEFFTVGAGLETTRASKKVNPWYFTTCARIGEQVVLGRPGGEPLSRHALAESLREQTERGMPGAVHPDAATYRRTVNRTLYGLGDDQFAALRRTLLQLRRPKLSDRLSDRGLADILQESLPPVERAITDELADGFERLDRHREEIAQMRTTLRAARSLLRSYRGYARRVAAARASTVSAAEWEVEKARARHTAAVAGLDEAKEEQAEVQRQLTAAGAARTTAAGRAAALRDSPSYQEGKDLEPLRRQAESMASAAATLQGQAERLAEQASRQQSAAHAGAEQAETAAADAQQKQRAADLAALPLPDPDLHSTVQRLATDLHEGEPSQARVESAIAATRESCTRLANVLDSTAKLVNRAADANRQLQAARGETADAERLLGAAEEQLAELLAAERAETATYVAAVDAYVAASIQLTRSSAPPRQWPDTEPERAVAAWVEHASRERLAQINAALNRLSALAGPVGELDTRLATVDTTSSDASDAYVTLLNQARLVQSRRERYAATVAGWAAALNQLPQAEPVPEWVTAPDPLRLRRSDLVEWADATAAQRTRELGGQAAEIRAELERLDEQIGALDAERNLLESGQVPAPEAPGTRLSPRTGRAGAPFYLLVDFVDGQTPHQRAILEAALVGCGLADAWVSPDGTLQPAADGTALLDTQLVSNCAPAARPLSEALRPDPVTESEDAVVPASVVSAILDRVSLAGSATTGEGLMVGRDGTWSVGVVRGAYQQDASRLVGAASREDRRRRRLAEVLHLLETLNNQRGSMEHHAKVVAHALTQTGTERASVPGDDELAGALSEFRDDAAACRRTAQTFAEAMSRLQPATDTTTAAVAHACSHAELDASHAAGAVATAMVEARATCEAAVAALRWAADQPPEHLAQAPPAEAEPFTAFHMDLAALNEAVTQLHGLTAAAGRALDTAGHAVAAERDAIPDTADLLTARTMVGEATTERNLRAREYHRRREDEAKLQKAHVEAVEIADAALIAAGLTGRADDLAQLSRAAGDYRQVAEDWLWSAGHAAASAATAGQAIAAAAESKILAETAAHEAGEATAKAGTTRDQYQTLLARVGVPFQKLATEITELDKEVARREKHLDELDQRKIEIAVTRKGAEDELTTAQAGVTEAEQNREHAAAGFRTVIRLGVLELADLAATLPPDLPAAGTTQGSSDVDTLGLRAIRDWARAVLDALPRGHSAQGAVDTAATRVAQDRYEAETALAGRVTIRDRWTDGILLLDATHNGVTRNLGDTAITLAGELDSSEKLLEHDESELFEEFLSDQVRQEVTTRIRAAHTLVKQMNQLMDQHPTSSGIRVNLHWRADETASIGQDVIDLLAKPPRTLLPSEREQLEQAFRRRIATVRSGDQSVPWRQHLAELLDYRRWHRFDLLYKRGDSRWLRLNRAQHGTLSGGEKAVALHLPLFAAAATHCQASRIRVSDPDGTRPGCPRLVLLDEIFAGVDQENRGALFDLIHTLDLDLVATSESETGLYAELDGLAIYHLIVDDTMPGVLAVRSVWDGEDLHRLLDTDADQWTA